MIVDEGYIKFSLDMRDGPPPDHPLLGELDEARSRLFSLGLIGVYDSGIGYGNVSVRADGTRFVITGSATGGKPSLGPHDYCEVSSFDLEKNRVVAVGPIPASSESMTHGAVYAAEPRAVSVMHVHSRRLFDQMRADGHLETPPSAAFGTPDMALAISRLVERRAVESGVFVTAGHDEGIIAYGPSIAGTLELLTALYQRNSAAASASAPRSAAQSKIP